MINTNMRTYAYFTLGGSDGYGQPQLSNIKGVVKMAINLNSQTITDNIKYLDTVYIGLTHDKDINDTYVIQYGEQKLKVLYVNTFGRYKQVHLGEYFGY